MLAFAGYVAVDLGFRVPFAPEVSSLYAHDADRGEGTMLGLFIPLAAIEIFAGLPKAFQLLNDPDAAAGGDYKFDPLGFGGGPTGELAEKELANGRAAILGFSGIVTQSALLPATAFRTRTMALSTLSRRSRAMRRCRPSAARESPICASRRAKLSRPVAGVG